MTIYNNPGLIDKVQTLKKGFRKLFVQDRSFFGDEPVTFPMKGHRIIDGDVNKLKKLSRKVIIKVPETKAVILKTKGICDESSSQLPAKYKRCAPSLDAHERSSFLMSKRKLDDSIKQRHTVVMDSPKIKELLAKRKKTKIGQDKSEGSHGSQKLDVETSNLLDVTGVESELSDSGLSNLLGHHEDWEFPNLENSGVSSEVSSTEKDSGHSKEELSEKKKDFIRKFLDEAEARFKAGEEILNLTPGHCLVSSPDDDNITEAADLVPYIKRKRFVKDQLQSGRSYKPLLEVDKITDEKIAKKNKMKTGPPMISCCEQLLRHSPSNRKENASDSVLGSFNFTLSDSDNSVQAVEHNVLSSKVVELTRKKKQEGCPSEDPTKTKQEFDSSVMFHKAMLADVKTKKVKKKKEKKKKGSKRIGRKEDGEVTEKRKRGKEEMKDKDRNGSRKENRQSKDITGGEKERRKQMETVKHEDPLPFSPTKPKKQQLEKPRTEKKKLGALKKSTNYALLHKGGITLDVVENIEICPIIEATTKESVIDTPEILEVPFDELKPFTAKTKKNEVKVHSTNGEILDKSSTFNSPEVKVSTVSGDKITNAGDSYVIPEVAELNSNNSMLLAPAKKKKKKGTRNVEDVERPLDESSINMKDPARKMKREKIENITHMTDINESGDYVKNVVKMKKKSRRKNLLRVEDIPEMSLLPRVEPGGCGLILNGAHKRKKENKVQDMQITDVTPGVIAEPTDNENYTFKIKKKKKRTLEEKSIPMETLNFISLNDKCKFEDLISPEQENSVKDAKRKETRNIQNDSIIGGILEVVDNASCEPVNITASAGKKKKIMQVTRQELIKATLHKHHTTDIADDSNHSPDLFDGLFEDQKHPVEKAVKLKKRSHYESVVENDPETQKASFYASKESLEVHEIKKKKNGNELEEMVCTKNSSVQSSQDMDSLSPWHRLSRDSNGSFTGHSTNMSTNSFQAANTQKDILHVHELGNSISQPKEDRISYAGKPNRKKKKVCVIVESTSEEMLNSVPVLNTPGMKDSSSRWHRPSLDSNSSFTDSNEDMFSIRSSAKELIGAQQRQSGTVHDVENIKVSKRDQNKDVSEMPPTGLLYKRLSMKINDADSDSSECEPNHIPGRGNLKGLTQKIPPENLNDHQKSSCISVESDGTNGTLSLCSLDERGELVFKNKQRMLDSKENVQKTIKTRMSSNNGSSVANKFKCTRCKSYFVSALLLGQHFCYQAPKKRNISEPFRTENAPFQCKECGNKYAQKAYLNHHLKATHLGIRPFQCDECLMSFSEKSTLIVHQRLHSKELPYKCYICDRGFVNVFNLHRHYGSGHKLVANFPCDLCLKKNIKFFFEIDLQAHHKKVHKLMYST